MSGTNEALAAIIGRDRLGEDGEEALVAAILDGGVYVAYNDQGSAVLVRDDTSSDWVLVSFVRDDRPESWPSGVAGVMHCDALRLVDIAQGTKARFMAIFSEPNWAMVEFGQVFRMLSDRGRRVQQTYEVRLRWSTHPVARAIRTAVAERIRSFPGVRSVWIAHAQEIETGHEYLMVHMAVDESAPQDGKALMDTVIREDVVRSDDDLNIGFRVFGPAEADAIREIDQMGLDTVRFDPATSRVHVLSREFD